jgi:hypothetical protein
MTTIKAQAERCMQAFLSEDYADYAAYLHTRMFEMLGGAEGLARLLGMATAHMQADGQSVTDIRIGEPGPPRAIGGWLVALVPQTTIVTQRSRRQSGRLEIRAFLVAISEDVGRTWQFIDAAWLQDPEFSAQYPELDSLELPAPTEPTFTPDP